LKHVGDTKRKIIHYGYWQKEKAARQRQADLHDYKYFKRFIGALERFHLIKAHHNRDLHYDQYIALILFCFFNPVLASLRAIQLASG